MYEKLLLLIMLYDSLNPSQQAIASGSHEQAKGTDEDVARRCLSCIVL